MYLEDSWFSGRRAHINFMVELEDELELQVIATIMAIQNEEARESSDDTAQQRALVDAANAAAISAA